MILPHEIMQALEGEADRIGIDPQGGQHWRTRMPPEPILQDLRFAHREQFLTVWNSPRYRAILMATQGHGELVLYNTQAQYENALQAARQGNLPGRDGLAR